MRYFLLVILIGYVLRFLSTVGLSYYIRNTPTQKELENKLGFYVGVVIYGIGTLTKNVGIVLVFALLIKQYFLT
jgi:hypothetical protein